MLLLAVSSSLVAGQPSKLCSLVKTLTPTNPAMCFSEPECEEKCSLVDEVKCQTRQEQECRTVNQNKCSVVQEQVCGLQSLDL